MWPLSVYSCTPFTINSPYRSVTKPLKDLFQGPICILYHPPPPPPPPVLLNHTFFMLSKCFEPHQSCGNRKYPKKASVEWTKMFQAQCEPTEVWALRSSMHLLKTLLQFLFLLVFQQLSQQPYLRKQQFHAWQLYLLAPMDVFTRSSYMNNIRYKFIN